MDGERVGIGKKKKTKSPTHTSSHSSASCVLIFRQYFIADFIFHEKKKKITEDSENSEQTSDRYEDRERLTWDLSTRRTMTDEELSHRVELLPV